MIGWVIAMLTLGMPIYIFLAPAAGVVLGWAVGGLVYLLLGAIGAFRPRL